MKFIKKEEDIMKKLKKWLIGIVILSLMGGCVANGVHYDRTRPIIEGEVVSMRFRYNDISYLTVHETKRDKNIVLSLDTKKKEPGVYINFGPPGDDFHGKTEELKEMIDLGDTIRVKIKDKAGITKEVYKILDVYKKI